MAERTPIAEKIAALNALREDPTSEATGQKLRTALEDRSNRVVARAAEMVGDSDLDGFVPELLRAFQRLLKEPLKKEDGMPIVLRQLQSHNVDEAAKEGPR